MQAERLSENWYATAGDVAALSEVIHSLQSAPYYFDIKTACVQTASSRQQISMPCSPYKQAHPELL